MVSVASLPQSIRLSWIQRVARKAPLPVGDFQGKRRGVTSDISQRKAWGRYMPFVERNPSCVSANHTERTSYRPLFEPPYGPPIWTTLWTLQALTDCHISVETTQSFETISKGLQSSRKPPDTSRFFVLMAGPAKL